MLSSFSLFLLLFSREKRFPDYSTVVFCNGASTMQFFTARYLAFVKKLTFFLIFLFSFFYRLVFLLFAKATVRVCSCLFFVCWFFKVNSTLIIFIETDQSTSKGKTHLCINKISTLIPETECYTLGMRNCRTNKGKYFKLKLSN